MRVGVPIGLVILALLPRCDNQPIRIRADGFDDDGEIPSPHTSTKDDAFGCVARWPEYERIAEHVDQLVTVHAGHLYGVGLDGFHGSGHTLQGA